ncbi:MAG: branched-chain amino acid ABC transporter substrate-binding protein [Deltaproteobacteria bacterium]|nr:branched-chain amino acid ABC transporter substrate-binding protein [Deltaproteobacteria bacterium]
MRRKRGISLIKGIIVLCMLLVFLPSTGLAQKAKTSAQLEPEYSWAGKVNAAFDIKKMGDMSDFDPANPIVPKGDTIKIAFINSFSGPAAISGQITFVPVMWAVHDINKRGGIWVDGKKKLIELLQVDHQSKPDVCKKVAERAVLQDKVHVLMGTSGGHLMKIISEVGNKYKVIVVNTASPGDEVQSAESFGRYSFMPSASTDQIGRGMAYYYGQIRKKEKKFYVLCQDYSYGRSIAEGFKKGLKLYYPEAQVVGEDYHKLFLTDFAPYLEKIKASGAEVVWTGDWLPDSGNLLKQSRAMGMKIPFANLYMNPANELNAVGVEGSKGLVHICYHDEVPFFKYPGYDKFFTAWHDQWKKWKTAPFNGETFEFISEFNGAFAIGPYWLFSVIERAKSTDPEKIIKVWEGDTYRYANGKVLKMRVCDHKAIQNLTVKEFVPPDQQKVSYTIPPYYWSQKRSAPGPAYIIPAPKVLPLMDQNLDRCKGKSDWGE